MTRLATVQRSFPTFRLIVAPFRWIGRSRRRLRIAVLLLLVMMAGPPSFWALQLWGLPDIGEPFDVRAFREMTIPDDRNAFVPYRQAAEVLKPLARYVEQPLFDQLNWLAGWSETTPKVRQWAEENRRALALFRLGAERPDALDSSLFSERDHDQMSWSLECLKRLAFLEASRLQEQGDMAGAWGWYRAVLRLIHQVGLHGTLKRRQYAVDWHVRFRGWVEAWARDPRTSPAILRRAIDDATACASLMPSESYTLQAEYLEVEKWLDDPGGKGHQPTASFRNLGNPHVSLNPDQVQFIWDAWRFGRRETERSRRIIRLLVSNWLAYHDLPPDRRPDPSLNASACDLYAFGPDAPAAARALSPEALDDWIGTSIDARQSLARLNWQGFRSLEHREYRTLLIELATELYRRDHGTDPPTPEALVGPYLKSLPAE